MTDTLRAWLGSRTPPPPGEVEEAVVESVDDGVTTTPKALMAPAIRHLDFAASHPGRNRESAFALLTADALVTYAAEAALEQDDPDQLLREMTERLSSP